MKSPSLSARSTENDHFVVNVTKTNPIGFEVEKKKKKDNIVITGSPSKMDLFLSLPPFSILPLRDTPPSSGGSLFSFVCSRPSTCLLLCAPAPASPPGTSRPTGQMSLITLKSPSTETQTSAFSQGLYLNSDKKIAVIRSNYLPSFKTTDNDNRK